MSERSGRRHDWQEATGPAPMARRYDIRADRGPRPAEPALPRVRSRSRAACAPIPAPPRTVCKERFVAAAIELKDQRKAASPSREAAEASARLDLATERGCFMADVPDADVAARLQDARPL